MNSIFRSGFPDGIVRDGSGQDAVNGNGYGKQRPLLHKLSPCFLSVDVAMPIPKFCPEAFALPMGKNGRERNNALLVEHEENRHHETNEGSQVVPAEVVLENNDGEERKHRKRDALLDDLELNETERAAVAFKPDAVGRHHEAVFKESDRPGKSTTV